MNEYEQLCQYIDGRNKVNVKVCVIFAVFAGLAMCIAFALGAAGNAVLLGIAFVFLIMFSLRELLKAGRSGRLLKADFEQLGACDPFECNMVLMRMTAVTETIYADDRFIADFLDHVVIRTADVMNIEVRNTKKEHYTYKRHKLAGKGDHYFDFKSVVVLIMRDGSEMDFKEFTKWDAGRSIAEGLLPFVRGEKGARTMYQ